MSELNYGVNVENLLYELSQHESSDIGDFDVYGEDEQGREGCASVDITLLAADALKMITDLKVQCNSFSAEIARRDEIFIPIYPDENLMNKLTDVFHDTAKIAYEEDDVYVGNPELVITALINNFFLHGGQPHNIPVDFLNSVRAGGVEMCVRLLRERSESFPGQSGLPYAALIAESLAEQLRAGAPS